MSNTSIHKQLLSVSATAIALVATAPGSATGMASSTVQQGSDTAGKCERLAGRAAHRDSPEILPHVHLLITTRAYDPGHPDVGRIRQTWIRTDRARKALAEKWWACSGMLPRNCIIAE